MLLLQMLEWRRRCCFTQLFILTWFPLTVFLHTASAQTTVFINEIHYDNAGADANEAIEIAGPAGTDLTGWSIVLYNGNGGAVYDTKALSGTIPDLCSGFGMIVQNYPANGMQNGAPDGIALVNSSNAVIQFLSYEGSFIATAGPANGMVSTDIGVAEAGTEPLGQSLQLSGTGQLYEDFTWNPPAASTFGACNTGQNFVGGDAAPKEIFEIQGSGLASPFANQNVTTENNVVTVVDPNGFFMQTPAARSDNEAQTSDGIFVFTGSTPVVNVGDLVNVTGDVVEFFNFTEFSNNPAVTKVSSGNPLPTAVQFDNLTPSPNQPQAATAYERFESMLVQIANGVVAASNQTFGSDLIAEALIVAGPDRPFREPGIEYPGIAGLPVWDRNPEIFEFDPDRLGLPNMIIPAGSAFSATGVLGFEFGGYELWPTSYSVQAATLPRAVRGRNTGESTIATLNLHLLYDDLDDPGIGEPVMTPQAYADKLNKLSLYIRTLLGAPDILAVQEAENLKVLQDLAKKINNDDAAVTYTPYLVEGNDISGIDVGFLVRRGVTVNAVTQLGATEVFTLDNTMLHDRPPLLLQAKLADSSAVAVLAVHLRSLNGIDDPNDGSRVRQKRHEQAVSVSNIVQHLQTGNPNIHLAVAGDFNAFQFTDGYVHVLGQIMGTPASASEALIPGTDHVNPDLTNAVLSLPANEQYSFVFAGSAQVLDHILISQAFQSSVTGIQYARANADAAESFETDGTTVLRASDHDGLVLFVKKAPPNAVVSSDPLAVISYELEQNYPNPFSANGTFGNPSTKIQFSVLEAGRVQLSVYNLQGQEVHTLVSGQMDPGRHAITWNGQDNAGKVLPSGVYLYKLRVNGIEETKKMTLMK